MLIYTATDSTFTKINQEKLPDIRENVTLLINFITPSILLIVQLQLFNWFSKKNIAVVYGLLSVDVMLA
jgi:hypothetical protein